MFPLFVILSFRTSIGACAEFSNFASSKIVETFGPRLNADGYAEVANKLRKS